MAGEASRSTLKLESDLHDVITRTLRQKRIKSSGFRRFHKSGSIDPSSMLFVVVYKIARARGARVESDIKERFCIKKLSCLKH